MPKPNHVQLSFRITDDLHQRLVRAAAQSHSTINSEMKTRILRSFEEDRNRQLGEIVGNLDVVWHRFESRFLELDLQDEILSALAERNYDKARVLAVKILENREDLARKQRDKAAREAAALRGEKPQ